MCVIIIARYHLAEKPSGKIHSVVSEEIVPCPCCLGDLRCIGSRLRGCLDEVGTKMILSIRRLRCLTCRKIHHELPDRLVPYKRYEAKVLELTHAGNLDAVIEPALSTVNRWRQWFFWFTRYADRCREALSFRFGLMDTLSTEAFSSYGWLAGTVRMVANSNLWVHTRSAWMSGG